MRTAAKRTKPKKVVKKAAKKPATKRLSARKAPRPSAGAKAVPASKLIDGKIRELGDWRGRMLQRVRELILEAEPEVIEDWKWDIPVWSHNGILCTGETYKQVVKLTFAKGAALEDPSRLFNSSLGGNVRRAIDIRENELINEVALKALIRDAVAHNLMGK